MSLKGGPQLRARLKAIRQTFKPIGRQWGGDVVDLARPHIPVRTGKTQGSLRVRNATQRRAAVVANFPAILIDQGAKRHDIRARKARVLRFNARGQTIFARRTRHPGMRPRPYRQRVARQALDRHPMAEELIRLWNSIR